VDSKRVSAVALTHPEPQTERSHMRYVRCPGVLCNHAIFMETEGIIDPPKDFKGTVIRQQCICKDRRCKRAFTVRIGIVIH